MYRLFFLLFNLFCLFLFYGCSKKTFLETWGPDLKKLPLPVYESSNFPLSLSCENLETAKLTASKNEEFSFFMEHYQLSKEGACTDESQFSDWKTLKSGAKIQRIPVIEDSEKWENVKIFFRSGTEVLYVSIMEKESSQPERIFPAIFTQDS